MDVIRYGRGMNAHQRQRPCRTAAKSAFDLNIPLWLSSPVRELIVENGAVRGAMVEREGRLVRVRARRGVILACGGFPHDVARRKAMFPHALMARALFARSNRQHRRRSAAGRGGRRRVEDTLPNAAAWVPVSITRRKDGNARRDAALHRQGKTRRDRRHARRRRALRTKAIPITTSSRR